VALDHHRRGIGRRIYSELLDILTRQRIANAYAGIAQPNPASVAFHEAMGFEPVGVYRKVGYKLGAWHDVGWWARRLSAQDDPPSEPIPFSELAL
jgi:phosphinothricin acetyltransferase